MPTPWRNWSGSASATPQAVRSPTSEEEIIAVVRDCRARGVGLRVVGAGHSFTPLAATDGVLVSLDGWQGVEGVDFPARRATARAGTRLGALGAELHRHGLAQENLGDIDVQSIAGAISTGTHGTGITLGGLATQVAGLRLVTADGAVLECSEERERGIFKAAQVGLGALGVISAVTLRLLPAYRLHYTWGPEPLDALLERLAEEREGNRHFEFFWMPYTNTALVKRMRLTDEPAWPTNRLRQLNDLVLENGALWLLSELCRMRPSASAAISRLIARLMSSGEDVQYSHRVFATPRLVRFNEMEYSFPAELLADIVRDVAACIERGRFEVHFPIECRFVRGDDIPLSPAYGRDSAYVAVHMYRGMPHQAFFDAMEAIFRSYGGRPHWGKLHTRTADELRALYPAWDAFQQARRALDPEGLFLNPYLRRVLGEERRLEAPPAPMS